MTWTTPTHKQLFFTKHDPQDPRLGEIAKPMSLKDAADLNAITEPSWLILGYPDDAGIFLNGGRIGASEAPSFIRGFFYKTTPSMQATGRPRLVDIGDVNMIPPLAERHDIGREIVRTALTRGHRTISLGGGHDYGYADGAGFLEAQKPGAPRPIIINFDAHLDVRPSEKCLSSGTPFYRLLTQYSDKFDFIEVGLQNQCNSQQHLEWARQRGTQFLHLSQIREQGLLTGLKNLLADKKGRPCFLSLDMDAFTSNEAPGCSQSWTTGLNLQEFLPALEWLQDHLQIQSLGIYEVSPPLDENNRTTKMTALVMHHFLFHPESLRWSGQ